MVAVALFALIVVLMEAWHVARVRGQVRSGGESRAGEGAIVGAIFAIVDLLYVFTFTSAAGRFDIRRGLISREANAIGTAWMRLDLLDAAGAEAIRGDLRRCVDGRTAQFEVMGDRERFMA